MQTLSILVNESWKRESDWLPLGFALTLSEAANKYPGFEQVWNEDFFVEIFYKKTLVPKHVN